MLSKRSADALVYEETIFRSICTMMAILIRVSGPNTSRVHILKQESFSLKYFLQLHEATLDLFFEFYKWLQLVWLTSVKSVICKL